MLTFELHMYSGLNSNLWHMLRRRAQIKKNDADFFWEISPPPGLLRIIA